MSSLSFVMEPPVVFATVLEIVAAGMRFVAQWEEELAPKTVAAFKASLPLDDLWGRCDYISVHTPLSDETRNIIGAGHELSQHNLPEPLLLSGRKPGVVPAETRCRGKCGHRERLTCRGQRTSPRGPGTQSSARRRSAR